MSKTLPTPGYVHRSAERLGDAKECECVIQESITHDKQVPHGEISGCKKFRVRVAIHSSESLGPIADSMVESTSVPSVTLRQIIEYEVRGNEISTAMRVAKMIVPNRNRDHRKSWPKFSSCQVLDNQLQCLVLIFQSHG